MTKSFLFLLFLFGIGYSVGPQFVQAMKRDGLKPVLLALVVCFTGLAAAIVVAKALALDPGLSAGLMSGALTQSSAMGTATDAINGLALSEADSRSIRGPHRSGGCRLLHLRLCGRDRLSIDNCTGAPEDRSTDGGAEARAFIGHDAREAGTGVRLAGIRGARLSVA